MPAASTTSKTVTSTDSKGQTTVLSYPLHLEDFKRASLKSLRKRFIISLSVFIFALFIAYRGPGFGIWFYYHPLLSLICLLPFSSIAVFIQQHNRNVKGQKDTNVMSQNSDSSKRGPGLGPVGSLSDLKNELIIPNYWHNYFMIAACVAIWGSVYVIYTNKEMNNKAHFKSVHGKMGLALAILYTIAAAFAILLLWGYPTNNHPIAVKLSKIKTFKLSLMAKIHRLLGRSWLLLMFFVSGLGWNTLHGNLSLKDLIMNKESLDIDFNDEELLSLQDPRFFLPFKFHKNTKDSGSTTLEPIFTSFTLPTVFRLPWITQILLSLITKLLNSDPSTLVVYIMFLIMSLLVLLDVGLPRVMEVGGDKKLGEKTKKEEEENEEEEPEILSSRNDKSKSSKKNDSKTEEMKKVD